MQLNYKFRGGISTWPLTAGACLIEVAAWAGLNCIILSNIHKHLRVTFAFIDVVKLYDGKTSNYNIFVKTYLWYFNFSANILYIYLFSYSCDMIFQNELQGSGSCLGYRSMTARLRNVHGLRIPRCECDSKCFICT